MRFLPVVLLTVLAAHGADDALGQMRDSQRQTMDALIRDARAITDAAAAEVASKESWEPHREQRLEEMRDMLGLLPWPERTPLNVNITGVLDRPAYTVEKLAFESLPKVYVTANLYVPKQREGRVPAVVYVCGHSYSPAGAKTKYQRHGISLAKNGYVAIVLDPIQIAETFALHHGVYSQQMYEWYARGYSPAGVEVWNAMRAIDYLETRDEVDADRIGMTGRSGGAAMTWFTASVDPRVKVAVPVMGISTYAANLANDAQRHHCDCMFMVNFFRHGLLHQGALIAPRPLLMAHGRKDVLFPVSGYEEFEKRISALYRSYGREDAFRNIVVDTAHKDSDYLREEAIRWFDRYLLGKAGRELDLAYTDEPAADLRVFAGSPPSDARNHLIHETFLPTPEPKAISTLEEWRQRKNGLIRTLREKVFRGFPANPAALDVRITPREGDEYFQDFGFVSQQGVEVRGLLHRPSKSDRRLPAFLYVASDGEDPDAIRRFFRQPRPSSKGIVRLAVYPRGVGEISWPKSFWWTVFRNAMQTGQSVGSLRLWDVMRSVEALRSDSAVDPARITVAGRGASGVLALYAAILDPGVQQVLLLDAPPSQVGGPHFLGLLRYTDLPEVAALLAPRRLNFYSRMPEAFEWTRGIYSLYGKPDHIFLTMDLLNILEGRYDHGFASGL